MKVKKYNILIQSLRLVASSYKIQTTYLPDYTHIPDEIALIFNDTYLQASQLRDSKIITSNVFIMLEKLDGLFEVMSQDSSLWTLEKLKDDIHWEETRVLALAILKEMKEIYDCPNLDFTQWLNGNL